MFSQNIYSKLKRNKIYKVASLENFQKAYLSRQQPQEQTAAHKSNLSMIILENTHLSGILEGLQETKTRKTASTNLARQKPSKFRSTEFNLMKKMNQNFFLGASN